MIYDWQLMPALPLARAFDANGRELDKHCRRIDTVTGEVWVWDYDDSDYNGVLCGMFWYTPPITVVFDLTCVSAEEYEDALAWLKRTRRQ